MKLTGDGAEDTGSKLGYNFVYGFQKPISTVGTYWGMEFGLGSRGWGDSEDGYKVSQMAHNVQVSPFTFGYKYNITDAVAIDAHLGAYVSFDYVGKYKEEEERLLKARKKREEKEKIAEKQAEKKAEEEKAAERRAERKEHMEKLMEGTYKVSATGTDVKSVTQNIVAAVPGTASPTGGSSDIKA